MTTIESISLLKPVTYAEISSCEAEDWQHPMLEMFRPIVEEHEKQKARLYLIPSSFDDEYDPDFSPQPTSASDLPELHQWTMKFVVSVLEIWAGRRSPSQLTRMCHRKIFTELHARACKTAGIDGLTLHGLRRSFKSLSEWLEIPAGVVAQLIEHSVCIRKVTSLNLVNSIYKYLKSI